MRFDDANARARGLATHLLGRAQLVHLLDLGTWRAAVREAADFGYPAPPAAAVSPAEFDRVVGRVAAARLAVLRRWLGHRAGALTAIFEDEDRRSLRLLLRGAAQGAAPATRLQSLIPTPSLPERALERLARAATPAEMIRSLVRMGHPAGRALARATHQPGSGAAEGPVRPPGLFGLELALARVFAVRATRAVRRAGRLARRFVGSMVDLENAWSLMAAPGWVADVPAGLVCLPGGVVLGEQEFTRLARLDGERIPGELARAFRRGPLAAVFAADADGASPGELEARARSAQVAWYRDESWLDPLGPGVLFAVIERIRNEAHDLRLIVVALTMGASPAQVEPLLATAA